MALNISNNISPSTDCHIYYVWYLGEKQEDGDWSHKENTEKDERAALHTKDKQQQFLAQKQWTEDWKWPRTKQVSQPSDKTEIILLSLQYKTKTEKDWKAGRFLIISMSWCMIKRSIRSNYIEFIR